METARSTRRSRALFGARENDDDRRWTSGNSGESRGPASGSHHLVSHQKLSDELARHPVPIWASVLGRYRRSQEDRADFRIRTGQDDSTVPEGLERSRRSSSQPQGWGGDWESPGRTRVSWQRKGVGSNSRSEPRA